MEASGVAKSWRKGTIPSRRLVQGQPRLEVPLGWNLGDGGSLRGPTRRSKGSRCAGLDTHGRLGRVLHILLGEIMAAELAPAMQRRIYELRKEGWRLDAIAKEVGCGRSTAARYAKRADNEVKLGEAPAADLNAQQVAMLRALADRGLELHQMGVEVDVAAHLPQFQDPREVEALKTLASTARRALDKGEPLTLTNGSWIFTGKERGMLRRLAADGERLLQVARLMGLVECCHCKRKMVKLRVWWSGRCSHCGRQLRLGG